MADEAIKAPVVEDKGQQTANSEAVTPTANEGKTEEKSVGELLGDKTPTKEPRLVPESVLIEYKKNNKELAKKVAELQTTIEAGATQTEVTNDLKAIADQYGVDEKFLAEFARAVRSQAKAEVEDTIKPFEEREKSAKVDKLFNEHYEKLMEAMPEYKDIANKDIIKALALKPENANKPFTAILEEAYGHLLSGKRTLEPTTPGGGKEDVSVDFDRAKKDSNYFKEIMSDPNLKKQYNDSLTSRLKL